MTRFEMNLKGLFGEFWKKDAEREIEKMAEWAYNGEILLDGNCAAYWAQSGHYLPEECVEKLSYTGFFFDRKATDEAREAQDAEFIARYRENWKAPSAEEMAEIRANFGDETVIDVLTGEIIR